MAAPQIVVPAMDIRVHGQVPAEAAHILTPDALRFRKHSLRGRFEPLASEEPFDSHELKPLAQALLCVGAAAPYRATHSFRCSVEAQAGLIRARFCRRPDPYPSAIVLEFSVAAVRCQHRCSWQHV
eukprot:9369-Heterococcus_DN1.PRE.1